MSYLVSAGVYCVNVQLVTDFLVFFSVRTPGGRLVYQYKKKARKIPKCGMCKTTLRGIRPARAHERKRMSLRQKKVYRAYGGCLCHNCVREK